MEDNMNEWWVLPSMLVGGLFLAYCCYILFMWAFISCAVGGFFGGRGARIRNRNSVHPVGDRDNLPVRDRGRNITRWRGLIDEAKPA